MNKEYKKRIYIVFALVMLIYAFAIVAFYNIATNSDYAILVAQQQISSIELAESRGTIYDCNLVPLSNNETKLLAVEMPIDSTSNGKPIVFYAEEETSSNYIDYFEIETQSSVASNLLGYTDFYGFGVSGVQKAFDDILAKNSGELKMYYTVDALGRMIVGESRDYKNTLDENDAGVILTIDSQIQAICEEEASKLSKGAIVVVSVPDCNLLASVSYPSFDPENVGDYIESEDSPFVNRVFASYQIGSVFKLVVATTALKYGYDYNEEFLCDGSITIGSRELECYEGTEHGICNMQLALQKSCNGYFVNLAQEIGAEKIWQTAFDLGFGTETVFYDDYMTSSGNLTDLSDLNDERALANFSIGQGDLTASPIKIAELINCIASGGIYVQTRLYEGEYLSNGDILYNYDDREKTQIMSEKVAIQLGSYMETVADFGTGVKGNTEDFLVASKTGTAETSLEDYVNYWYAGYIGNENAEYAIVVLSESAEYGNNPTGEIFKNISQKILDLDI